MKFAKINSVHWLQISLYTHIWDIVAVFWWGLSWVSGKREINNGLKPDFSEICVDLRIRHGKKRSLKFTAHPFLTSNIHMMAERARKKNIWLKLGFVLQTFELTLNFDIKIDSRSLYTLFQKAILWWSMSQVLGREENYWSG